MERSSIDAFRTEITRGADASARKAAALAERELEMLRTRLECTKQGVAILAGAAILDLAFEGFPPSIDLSFPNGHNAGLSTRRENGVWRLHGNADTLRKTSMYSFGTGYLKGLAGHALAAMGIPHSPDAVRRLQGLIALSDAGKGALSKVAKLLPLHAVAAIPGLGSEGARAFGLDHDDRHRFLQSSVAVAKAMGADLDAPPADRIPPALVSLAEKGEAGLIAFALAKGFLRPNSAVGDHTAAAAAVSAGRCQTLVVLRQHGERIDVVDSRGDTLLHAAARLIESWNPAGPDAAAPIAAFLLREGVPPDAKNLRGQTAFDVAEEAARSELVHEGAGLARDLFEAVIEAAQAAPRR